jgi:hypothetical protein
MITHILIGSCAVVLILLTLMYIHFKHNHVISNLATTLMSACLGTKKCGVSTKFYACNPEVHFSQVITGKFYNITSSFFSPMPPHVPCGLRGLLARLWPKCNPASGVGTLMRRSYVVSMRWMVIYEYEVPGGALNLSSTKLPRPWWPWESSPSRKNPHVRTRNRTQDIMISSQKLWPLYHEAGHITRFNKASFANTFFKSLPTCLAISAIHVYRATDRVVKEIKRPQTAES